VSGDRPGAPVDPFERFADRLPFPPDPFQRAACHALDAHRSVLVSAPTGSGKTVVAMYGVERTVSAGKRAFYTTPLKALSNQKFAELSAAHGPSRVGLLTGDTSVNPEAPVVVMTTEVLRNMLLADAQGLDQLGMVVLDEVHYLQDPYRGGVWEEVLVLTPPSVRFVCLSATVSNAAELAGWLRSVRGPTELVVERARPVALRHHVAVRRREEPSPTLVGLLRDGAPDPAALALDAELARARRRTAGAPGGGAGGRRRGHPGRRFGDAASLPLGTPRRTEVVELLEQAGMLPAIVFIFSRAACDDAVRQCVDGGIRLTSAADRHAIRTIAEEHVEAISDRDLRALGYGEWTSALESGVAAHHAGMVPAFREAVEHCFSRGLLHVVFATETLALGINMPARTVVLERFSKFGSAGRAALTAGEYAQMTGRAGRRGLDDEGHAVVLWNPNPEMSEIAGTALSEPGGLRSSFRPTYNLTANLVRSFDRPTAMAVLGRSFAQWQADRSSVPGRRERLVERFARRLSVLEELGYVRGWRLTEAGERLTRTYHECDLLVSEVLAGPAVEDVDPPVLAAVLSSVVFERRRSVRRPGTGHPGRLAPRHPPGRSGGRQRARRATGSHVDQDLDRRMAEVMAVAEQVRATEEVHRVPPTRMPDPALARAVHIWASGGDLDDAFDAVDPAVTTLAAGDFVRLVRQVADLVGQAAAGSGGTPLTAAARAVLPTLVRDVVATQPAAATSTTPRSTTERTDGS